VKRLFADSFFFIALLSERDACHHRAAEISRDLGEAAVPVRFVEAG
jgi:hypothetical protein